MNPKHTIAIVVAVVFGVARLFIHPSTPSPIDFYKDAVHIFMGVIGTVAWQGDKTCKWIFWLLSAIEVTVAVVSRI